MKKFIQSNPVISFIGITLLYSWTLWLLMILSARGILPFKFPTNFLGSFGPAVGSLTVTGVIRGRQGLNNIFKSLIAWRSSAWTYLFSIFFIIVVYILTIVMFYFVDPETIKTQPAPGLAAFVIYFLLIAVVGGPLGEEIGWRGFLQPELMKRFNPVVTSLLIALIWLIWHLPLFWLEGAAQSGGSVLYFALSVLTMAFLFTLLYIKSKGSLLMAVLFHTMINYVSAFVVPGIFPAVESDRAFGHASTFILAGLGLITFIIYLKTFSSVSTIDEEIL